MKKIRAAVAALGLAAVLALSVSPAVGHKQAYDTSLQLKVDTLTATTTQYSGSVRSEKAACKRNRAITITTAGVAIAQVVSDGAGNFTTIVTGTPPAKNQDVIASTPKKFIKRNSKHKHKCKPASVTRKATGPPA